MSDTSLDLCGMATGPPSKSTLPKHYMHFISNHDRRRERGADGVASLITLGVQTGA